MRLLKNALVVEYYTKIVTFVWKFIHNGIATKGNIGKLGFQMSCVYDLCGIGEEDV